MTVPEQRYGVFSFRTPVTLRWGAGTAEGKIGGAYTRTASRTTGGERIGRNASKEQLASLVRQGDGGLAQKPHGEVETAR